MLWIFSRYFYWLSKTIQISFWDRSKRRYKSMLYRDLCVYLLLWVINFLLVMFNIVCKFTVICLSSIFKIFFVCYGLLCWSFYFLMATILNLDFVEHFETILKLDHWTALKWLEIKIKTWLFATTSSPRLLCSVYGVWCFVSICLTC